MAIVFWESLSVWRFSASIANSGHLYGKTSLAVFLCKFYSKQTHKQNSRYPSQPGCDVCVLFCFCSAFPLLSNKIEKQSLLTFQNYCKDIAIPDSIAKPWGCSDVSSCVSACSPLPAARRPPPLARRMRPRRRPRAAVVPGPVFPMGPMGPLGRIGPYGPHSPVGSLGTIVCVQGPPQQSDGPPDNNEVRNFYKDPQYPN